VIAGDPCDEAEAMQPPLNEGMPGHRLECISKTTHYAKLATEIVLLGGNLYARSGHISSTGSHLI
jgi:uncharacterized Zn-binding protein involved in type VI secretion